MTNKNSIKQSTPSYVQHYAKLPYWTKEEAVVLAVGENPKNPNLPRVLDILKLADNKVPLIELLNRSIECNEISNTNGNVKPLELIKWTKKKDIPFSKELEKWVRRYHKNDLTEIDWKARCKELEVSSAELKKLVETKPLHGSEKLAYQKIILMQALISSGEQQFTYEALMQLLPEILYDAESLRNKGDNKLPFDLPCDKTIGSKYEETVSKLFPIRKSLLTQKAKIPKK